MSDTDNYRVTMERRKTQGRRQPFQVLHNRYRRVDVEAESNGQARNRAELENKGWRAVRAVRAKPRSS